MSKEEAIKACEERRLFKHKDKVYIYTASEMKFFNEEWHLGEHGEWIPIKNCEVFSK